MKKLLCMMLCLVPFVGHAEMGYVMYGNQRVPEIADKACKDIVDLDQKTTCLGMIGKNSYFCGLTVTHQPPDAVEVNRYWICMAAAEDNMKYCAFVDPKAVELCQQMVIKTRW